LPDLVVGSQWHRRLLWRDLVDQSLEVMRDLHETGDFDRIGRRCQFVDDFTQHMSKSGNR